MTVSQSRPLTCDCRTKERAQDTSWVICKSLVNDFDMKSDNYFHMLIQEIKQCKRKTITKKLDSNKLHFFPSLDLSLFHF